VSVIHASVHTATPHGLPSLYDMVFSSPRASLLVLAAAATLLPSASAYDCKEIVAQKTPFDLRDLGGPRVVHWEEQDIEHDVLYKYNFTLDICNALKSDCHNGARICAMRENIDLSSEKNSTMSVTPIDIAGTYTNYNGRTINGQFALLQDGDREGLSATLHGGRLPFDDRKNGVDQRAIIEFVCDMDRTGQEGVESGKEGKNKDDGKGTDGDKKGDDKDGDKKDGDKKDGEKDGDKKDGDKKDGDKKDGDKESRGLSARASKCEDSDSSLRFCGYDVEDDADSKDKRARTLRLEWRTKHACKGVPRDNDGGSHWGFFGWFFIM
jgi:hypothetical protein